MILVLDYVLKKNVTIQRSQKSETNDKNLDTE